MGLSADTSPPTSACLILALAYTTPREPRHSPIRTLITAHDIQPRLLHSQLAPAALVRVSLEPLVAIGTLLTSVFAFGGAYLILVWSWRRQICLARASLITCKQPANN